MVDFMFPLYPEAGSRQWAKV